MREVERGLNSAIYRRKKERNEMRGKAKKCHSSGGLAHKTERE